MFLRCMNFDGDFLFRCCTHWHTDAKFLTELGDPRQEVWNILNGFLAGQGLVKAAPLDRCLRYHFTSATIAPFSQANACRRAQSTRVAVAFQPPDPEHSVMHA